MGQLHPDCSQVGAQHGISGGSGKICRRPAIQLVAGTADREALLVQQFTNTADQEHLMMLVVATVASTLDRLELGKLLLPVTQNVGLDAA